jgi:hypothetical protein
LSDAEVIGIIEFGSTARQDADHYSDKDIFAVVEDVDADMLEMLREVVASNYGTTPSSVACYSASSFDQMVAHGSLFTWHLRLEGRVLSDPDGVFDESFGNLTPYSAFASDLARFRGIYEDARAAYGESELLDSFEMHVLFVVARNICMLLTARYGEPTFGRRTVIPKARALFPALPISPPVAEALAAGHLAYMRNIKVGESESALPESARIMSEVGELLAFAEESLTVRDAGRSHRSRRNRYHRRVRTYAETIIGAATNLSAGRALNYRERLQLERVVFRLTSATALRLVGRALQSMSRVAHDELLRSLQQCELARQQLDSIELGFTAMRLIASIANVDPYVLNENISRLVHRYSTGVATLPRVLHELVAAQDV